MHIPNEEVMEIGREGAIRVENPLVLKGPVNIRDNVIGKVLVVSSAVWSRTDPLQIRTVDEQLGTSARRG